MFADPACALHVLSSATRVPSSLNVCAHRSAPQVLQCVVWYICLLVADLTVPGTTCRHHKAVILLLPLATLLRGAGAVAGQRRAVASAGRHTCGGGQQPVPHAPQVRDRRWQAACQRQPELDGTGVLWLPLQPWSRLGEPLLRQQSHMGSSAGVAKLRVLKSSRAARQPGNSRVRRPVAHQALVAFLSGASQLHGSLSATDWRHSRARFCAVC